MKSSNFGTGRFGHAPARIGLGSALVFSAALLVVLGVVGCTSDEPNVVGTALVTDRIDTILVALGSEQIDAYSALRVENPDIPVHRQEVLYMGERQGTRSGGFIANYDFDLEFTADHPETLFTAEHIKSVKFSLTKLDFYSASGSDSNVFMPVDLYYHLQEIAAPFDSTAYENYPVETPAAVGPLLNSDFAIPNNSSEPLLPLHNATELLGWIDNREKVGFLVSFGAQSDSGLVGFASRELYHFSQLDDVAVGTVVAPNFVVEFNDGSIDNFLIEPYADTSTFEQVPDAAADIADGFILRTGLRSYPALLFDLSALPPHAFINRALLSVTNDTSVAYGALSAISVLEWDVARFGDPYRTMNLDELDDSREYYSFHITGQSSLDPHYNETIQFDVTQAVLRIINQVYTGTRGLILTGGEDFLPEGAFTSVTPDFYYREFRFLGTAAADQSQRPQLKITYSVVNDLEGEGK